MSKHGPVKKDEWIFHEALPILTIQPDKTNVLQITNNDSEPIMTITTKGEVIWHKPGQEKEAADIFCDFVQIRIENEAHIKQNRYDWEDRILEAMKKVAEKAPLTPEVLTDIFNKCIMVDKLKGIK